MSVVEGDGGEVEAAGSRKGHISRRRPPVNKWKRSPARQSAPSTGSRPRIAAPLSLCRVAALERFGFGRQVTPPHKRTLVVPRQQCVWERFGEDESVGICCGSASGS
ncbi:hypothetical protein MTO96_010046 [Rhipicephalus appendiculatus]